MNILDKITERTKFRVEKLKNESDTDKIRSDAYNSVSGSFMFEKALKKDDISFICEIKKASPSKGIIAKDFPYTDIAKEYENAGADAISVLTEPEFFLGDIRYLKEISQAVKLPLLRKDFIIDEIQLYESKNAGADAVLLICAVLNDYRLAEFINIAHKLGISCLVEAHDENEIKHAIDSGARIIGVNNRNLKTFEVDINRGLRLRNLIPDNIIFVSESGIKTPDDINRLRENKTDAVLIGETFMKSSDKLKELQTLKGNLR